VNTMPLHEAWSILGKDAKIIMIEVANLPRDKRAAALLIFVDEAKRLAKSLMAKHHPDRGGDGSEFRRVQDALSAIVHHTDEFIKRIADISQKAEEMSARRPVFIDVKR
jgi:hypothetical protein